MKPLSSVYRSGRIETAAGHTFTWGPAASGKTTSIRVDLTRDVAGGAEAWIIDPSCGLADWEDRASKYATTIPEARDLLGDAANRVPEDGPLVVVIEEAPTVFADGYRRRLAEHIVRYARRNNVRFRVTAQVPDLMAFGGSQLLRAALTQQ